MQQEASPEYIRYRNLLAEEDRVRKQMFAALQDIEQQKKLIME